MRGATPVPRHHAHFTTSKNPPSSNGNVAAKPYRKLDDAADPEHQQPQRHTLAATFTAAVVPATVA
jgi:hypothetical protein